MGIQKSENGPQKKIKMLSYMPRRLYSLFRRGQNFWKIDIQNTWEWLSEAFLEYYPTLPYSAGGKFFENRHSKYLRMALKTIMIMLSDNSLFRWRQLFWK